MDLATVALSNQREIERMFAALARIYPVYTLQECGWLQSAVIADPHIRSFWESMRQTVTGAMDDDQAAATAQQIAIENGVEFELITLTRSLPPQAMPQAYAGELARRAYMVVLSVKANELARALSANDDGKAREVVQAMHAEMPVSGATLPNALAVHERFERMVRAGNLAIPSYIPKLDTKLGGLERGTLIVLAARPSMGKSALAFQIVRNIATSGGLAIYFSLEMSAESLWARAACPLVGVSWRDVLNGSVKGVQLDQLFRESRALAETYKDNLRIVDTRQTTETIWQSTAVHHPDLIVVDHIRLCKDSEKNGNEVKRMGTITENLHDLAKALSLPVLAVAQLNRGAEETPKEFDNTNERKIPSAPTLKDLRGSGEIEENADIVLMMHRPDYYSTTPNKGASSTELWERKFRNGTRNIKINLEFDPAAEWFS